MVIVKIEITSELIVSILQQCAHHHVQVDLGLPQRAKVVGAYFDDSSQAEPGGSVILEIEVPSGSKLPKLFLPQLSSINCRWCEDAT